MKEWVELSCQLMASFHRDKGGRVVVVFFSLGRGEGLLFLIGIGIALESNKQTKEKISAPNVSVLKEKPLPNFATLQHFQHFYKDLSCT